MTIEIDQIKEQIDLRQLIGQYTTLIGRDEMQGPCPKCGGTDRFHVTASNWFCRDTKCWPGGAGKWGDAFDFFQWLEGCTFPQAVEKVNGAPVAVERRTPAVKAKASQPVSEEWRAKAEQVVAAAHHELITQAGFGEGGEYLIRRGIEPDTWRAFGLGFKADVPLPHTWDETKRQHIHPKQPAIVIPWYRGGKLTAIRYRFLQQHTYTDTKGRQATAKQTAQFGSDFTGILYGGQALLGCAEDLRTLVLCEGELNAISIWQVASAWGWDVLSLGSESAKLTPAAIDYAKRFERVIVWMDRSDVVKPLMHEIKGAYGVSSPKFGDKKRDANDMLKDGSLADWLSTIRVNACETDHERERFLVYSGA